MSAARLLEVSQRCADILLSHGPEASTRDLVSASGLSERTFFRMFPTKADSIRPLLEHGYHRFVSELAARVESDRTQPLIEAAVAAFLAAFEEPGVGPRPDLARLLVSAPAYRRVWLEINDDTATALLPVMASALNLAEDHIDVRLAAAQVTTLAVTAIRVMVDRGASPEDAASDVAASLNRHPLARPIGRVS
jgi:AcrR family transcriptional regulator